MNILSLFDGLSCGQIALKELGVKVDKYYASEVDKFAIEQTQLNFPDTIQLGDVTKWREWDIDWGSIDLVIGGSPCQGFSMAGKQLAFDDPRSVLFFEFVDVVNHVKNNNPNMKFLLENVQMAKQHIKVINDYMGVYPVEINSSLVSAQNRVRLYWSNIRVKEVGLFGEKHTDIPQPKDRNIYLKDILEKEVDDKYYLSDKMIKCFLNRPDGWADDFKPFDDLDNKARCLGTRQYRQGDNYIITHSTQPRQGKGQGGKGHLWKMDGKSYCLDTGCTTAIEVVDGVNQIGNIKSSSSFDNPQTGRVYGTNGKSPTLNTCGGGQREPKIPTNDRKIRRLTPTECARLQTIPDWYKWECSDTQQYKMLGNGWTVEVIKHIFSFL